MISKVPKNIKLLFPNIIWNIKTDSKIIYLTFDDGPCKLNTSNVLSVLEKYKAKATFFLIGKKMEQFPEVVKQIVANGHMIGNHSYSHSRFWFLTKSSVKNELIKTEKLLEMYTTEKQSNFRPPYGSFSLFAHHWIIRHYTIYMWSLTVWEFNFKISTEKCVSHITKNHFPGSIILLHDTISRTIEILESSLPILINQGYKFETLPMN